MPSSLAARPVGVFDSGVGGLSVLQALRRELPHEHFVYLADSGHAPYGERGDAFVQRRTLAIADFLHRQHGIKALVVACNTATAAAVEPLRAAMPGLPAIGVEPALKPAARSSQTRHVGVLATRGTVGSGRFDRLRQEHAQDTRFSVQACDGLAHAIEQSTGEPQSSEAANERIRTLCARYTSALGSFGQQPGEIDTLVLGCTHYVFAREVLRTLVGPGVQIIDTGAAVARQTRRILEQADALATGPVAEEDPATTGRVTLYTTGQLAALQAAAQRWLDLPAQCCAALPPAEGSL
ncbi:glutamate racemase [Ottowia sp.]|uniref:glutamate racemase n=1 Tax=Ottowia sp. TaxID=1898956 RepID=UPI002614B07C|nr:glutamate racemase [Ottowia sp.]